MKHRQEREAEKYSHSYPQYLPWSNRIWVLEEGELVEDNATRETYVIKEILHSPIPGAQPQIKLEKVRNN